MGSRNECLTESDIRSLTVVHGGRPQTNLMRIRWAGEAILSAVHRQGNDPIKLICNELEAVITRGRRHLWRADQDPVNVATLDLRARLGPSSPVGRIDPATRCQQLSKSKGERATTTASVAPGPRTLNQSFVVSSSTASLGFTSIQMLGFPL
jgi:hypothetical protein